MLKKIDHLGVAVHSIAEVKKTYKQLFDLDPEFEETVAEQKVTVVGFKIGESAIEFLEPTAPDSPIAKYLQKRGEGLHHLAVAVEDIAGMLQTMKAQGVRLIDETPRIGAEGKQIAFVHPKGFHGILLELSQDR